ncbi:MULTISPECIES: hypothetical protein [Wolbachia]|uniref:hypothetical protein n=1 Tax=Wolbachia TaxID=953 RepID=UPI0015FD7632|nr:MULTISPECIES: hypothetical protein [Wolbachia]MBA8757118.1 hypothetical protein [Wolbachia pipientis]MDE5058951.1 hypothetical protein [Wolbachia endosymbiont of Drosophila baimaii]
MHGNNDNGGGNIWPSHDKVEWVGPNKEKNRAEWERANSKPNTQLSSGSATSAGSSKDKGKSK